MLLGACQQMVYQGPDVQKRAAAVCGGQGAVVAGSKAGEVVVGAIA